MELQMSEISTLPTNTKIALITGASSEIGSAIIEKLVSADFYVIAQHNTKTPVFSSDVSKNTVLFAVNFLQMSELKNFVTTLEQQLPHLDLIVNCASLHDKHLEHTLDEYESFQKIALVNTFVPTYLLSSLHKKMLQRKDPLVILLSSYYAVGKGSLSNIFYTATKTSLLGLSRVFAREYNPIRSNVIIPGYVDTDTYRRGRTDVVIEQDKKSSLANMLTPKQSIVDTVEFMINNPSINATEIVVDGALYV